MVKKLFGVIHGVGLKFGGSLFSDGPTLAEYKVAPSTGLLREIASLPYGSKVGVEFYEELWNEGNTSDLIKSDVAKFIFRENYVEYWKEVCKYVVDHGHKLIFLEDIDFMKQIADSTRKAQELKLKRKSDDANAQDLNQKIYELDVQSNYELDVQSNYLFFVKREESILEKIKTEAPDVAIVGAGHSDNFIIKNMLEVDTYAREYFDDTPDFVFSEVAMLYGSVLPKLVYNPTIEPDIAMALVDHNERSMRVLKTGRIFPERTPDYTGTWSLPPSPPARGFFEMYIQTVDVAADNWLKGEIEDCFGSATFSGRINSESVSFIKHYKNAAIAVGGSKETLIYRGVREGDTYKGEVRGPHGNCLEEFTMQKFGNNGPKGN